MSSTASAITTHEAANTKNDNDNKDIDSNSNNHRRNVVLEPIADTIDAYSHIPEHGFSLFLAHRTKTIHFVRHAEGEHNQANQLAGDDTPITYSTAGSWKYLDAKLTQRGIQQCLAAREGKLMQNVHPELVVVSPFTRTLQTAHIMFSGKRIPFMVHHLCRERSGKFTCDKRRHKSAIMADILPLYKRTHDQLDHSSSVAYPTEYDEHWKPEREDSALVIHRAIEFMQWLAMRPETEIAVVTHSSWLKHLFRHFGHQVVEHKDLEEMHRLVGNAEVRSICLALHRGFYPHGTWLDESRFVPSDPSFHRGRWAISNEALAQMHGQLLIHHKNNNKDRDRDRESGVPTGEDSNDALVTEEELVLFHERTSNRKQSRVHRAVFFQEDAEARRIRLSQSSFWHHCIQHTGLGNARKSCSLCERKSSTECVTCGVFLCNRRREEFPRACVEVWHDPKVNLAEEMRIRRDAAGVAPLKHGGTAISAQQLSIQQQQQQQQQPLTGGSDDNESTPATAASSTPTSKKKSSTGAKKPASSADPSSFSSPKSPGTSHSHRELPLGYKSRMEANSNKKKGDAVDSINQEDNNNILMGGIDTSIPHVFCLIPEGRTFRGSTLVDMGPDDADADADAPKCSSCHRPAPGYCQCSPGILRCNDCFGLHILGVEQHQDEEAEELDEGGAAAAAAAEETIYAEDEELDETDAVTAMASASAGGGKKRQDAEGADAPDEKKRKLHIPASATEV